MASRQIKLCPKTQVPFIDVLNIQLPSSPILSALTKVSVSLGTGVKPTDVANLTVNYNLPKISFYFGNYAQRFSLSDMEFIFKMMKAKELKHAKILTGFNSNRELHCIRQDDDSVIIMTADNGRVFGVKLLKPEVNELLKAERILLFSLSSLCSHPERLLELLKGTYIYHMTANVKMILMLNCSECQKEDKINKHYCKTSFKDIKDIDELLEENESNPDFNSYFNTMMDDLFATCGTSNEVALSVMEDFNQNFRSDKQLVKNQVGLYMDYNSGFATIVDSFWKDFRLFKNQRLFL